MTTNRHPSTNLAPGTPVLIRNVTRAKVLDTDTLPNGQRIVFVETWDKRRFPANLELVTVAE